METIWVLEILHELGFGYDSKVEGTDLEDSDIFYYFISQLLIQR